MTAAPLALPGRPRRGRTRGRRLGAQPGGLAAGRRRHHLPGAPEAALAIPLRRHELDSREPRADRRGRQKARSCGWRGRPPALGLSESKWRNPIYSPAARTRRALTRLAGGSQRLLTEMEKIRPSLDLVQQNIELRRRLALFAEGEHQEDREVKGATNFLRALVRMAEKHAGLSKFARRCVTSITAKFLS